MNRDVPITISDLQGVARTLLVPLACRAIESIRPDAMIHDPCAVELYNRLGGSREFLLGFREHDRLFTVMRIRQFDTFARSFLARNPDGLVVDIGCGLDTRFHRLDDGTFTWLGVDLPEVIQLRRQWLPDVDRCTTIAQSMFELNWLDEVARFNKPVIFLAEGVFPYFSTRDVKPMLTAMAERFPTAELVFDALSPFVAWLNKSSSVLKRSGAEALWDAKNPSELETWGLRLLECWGYFDNPEPRLGGAANLMRAIPLVAKAAYVLHYRLRK
ncbi:MAG: class I SAM-dependent methyltransferase [Chloroflexi bacterium]|nr:class I SAM-dependent methyltransferase [Chloroflexota bacterium]